MAQSAYGTEETPSWSTILTWLHSDDPRLVAWGAHEVLVTDDRSLLPDLVVLAEGWRPLVRERPTPTALERLSQDQIDRRDALAAVLDTLIQMRVSLSADTLLALTPDFGNDVAVFLSRMHEDEAAPLSMELYRRSVTSATPHSYSLHYVAAAMLALHPPPGFAADLLRSTVVYAEVIASPKGSGNFGGWIGEGDCYVERDIPRKDWPLTGQYTL